MVKNLVWSIVIAVLVGAICIPIGKLVVPGGTPSEGLYEIVFVVATGIVGGILAYVCAEHWTLHALVRRVLSKCDLEDPLTRARVLLLALRLSASHEVDVSVRVKVLDWIKLLTAGAEYAKATCHMTYTIGLGEWAEFDRHSREYSDTLQSRGDIEKIRFVVQPRQVVQASRPSLADQPLIRDSVAAGITVKLYDEALVQRRIEDFALFDNQFAIAAVDPPGGLSLETKVRVRLLVGTGRVASYTAQVNALSASRPDKVFAQGG